MSRHTASCLMSFGERCGSRDMKDEAISAGFVVDGIGIVGSEVG